MATKQAAEFVLRMSSRPPTRPGMPARGMNPAHVAQHGCAFGNKAMNDPKRLNPVEPKSTRNPHSVNSATRSPRTLLAEVLGPVAWLWAAALKASTAAWRDQ